MTSTEPAAALGAPMTSTEPAAALGADAVLAARIGTFSFHGETAAALRDIEICVRPGTLTAVLGGSGSGKTTLGKLLAGWLRPGHSGTFTGSLAQAGEVLEFSGGHDDPRINPSAWSDRVGYVPQDAAAMLTTVRSTVAEELAFGLENRGIARPDMVRRVARVAELTGLTALLDRDPATLSGGELRRLAIACAVIQAPGVLVLDEPLASLDAAGIIQARNLIGRLTGAGTAVVVLSQEADGLARSASHWLVLDGGTATAVGPPRELIRSPELARTGTVIHAVTHTAVTPTPVAVRDSARQPAAVPALELEGVGFSFPRADGTGGEPLLRNLGLAVPPGMMVFATMGLWSPRKTRALHTATCHDWLAWIDRVPADRGPPPSLPDLATTSPLKLLDNGVGRILLNAGRFEADRLKPRFDSVEVGRALVFGAIAIRRAEELGEVVGSLPVDPWDGAPLEWDEARRTLRSRGVDERSRRLVVTLGPKRGLSSP